MAAAMIPGKPNPTPAANGSGAIFKKVRFGLEEGYVLPPVLASASNPVLELEG